MKATKALKRLAKIEALMSDVTERYVSVAPSVRKTLKDAMIAVAVAKKAVTVETASVTAKKAPVQQSGPASKAAPAMPKAKSHLSGVAATTKVAKKAAKKAGPNAPVKKTKTRKTAATKKTVTAPAQVAAETPDE